ncbi:Uncharacterised protein [Mycobacteroides abscessus]|nr:Uncharacterised protein [Mycobacteroides abscessus]
MHCQAFTCSFITSVRNNNTDFKTVFVNCKVFAFNNFRTTYLDVFTDFLNKSDTRFFNSRTIF